MSEITNIADKFRINPQGVTCFHEIALKDGSFYVLRRFITKEQMNRINHARPATIDSFTALTRARLGDISYQLFVFGKWVDVDINIVPFAYALQSVSRPLDL